jgi:AraC-like DNA-binding protein
MLTIPSQDYPKMYLYKRMVDAKLFIDGHYLDSINIDTIANRARLSKFHFIRLFKQLYGITPHKYITKLRMETAKEFLQKGLSISNTCYRLGFTSLSSFNKLFRQYQKINPSAYSRQIKDSNCKIAPSIRI